MESHWTILLDFDGTVSEPVELLQQYVEALTGQFRQNHGGDVEDWRAVTYDMLKTLTEEFQDYFVSQPTAPYNSYMARLYARSTEIVYASQSLPLPEDAVGFARRTQKQALQQCNATYPGVTEWLPYLLSQGHTLHMASGQESGFLQGAMQGASLEHLPTRWYGPDLIDCAKESPEYYRRIFQDLGVSPTNVVVLDDLPVALLWAQELGAKTVQAHFDPNISLTRVSGVSAVMTDWTQLPEILATLVY